MDKVDVSFGISKCVNLWPSPHSTGEFHFTLVSGNTEGRFQVDGASGSLKLVSVLDRETTASYTLEVTATDHGSPARTGTATVQLTVSDVNDNDPVVVSTLMTVVVTENSPVGTAVVTVSASDLDAGVNAQLTYSVVSGNAAGGFAIDAATGAVTVQTASVLDRETTSSFTLLIDVRDQATVANDVKSVTVTLLISLGDVNDNSPQFSPSNQYAATLNENDVVGTSVVDVDATDPDSVENAVLTYAITTGNTGGAFYIDPIDGIVYLQSALDRETIPSYTLEVTATDGAAVSSDRLTSTATIAVTVADFNDNPPVCPSNPYVVTTAEDTTVTTLLATVTCTEADIGVNSQIQYSISAGNGEAKFAIDGTTGAVSLVAALDYETTKAFSLVILAVDQGTAPLTGTAEVFVIVTWVNEHDPVMTVPGGGYVSSVSEDAALGDIIGTIVATDADDGIDGALRFSITAGNSQNRFDVDVNTGDILVVAALDREQVPSYTLTVQATDSLPANGDERSAETTIAVTITDINDNSPVFVPASFGVSVLEGAAIGATLLQLVVADDDTGVNGQHQLAIVAGNTGSAFSVSGDELLVAAALDNELLPQYVLTVEAVDLGSPALEANATVVVNVLPQNEFTPLLSPDSGAVTLFEDIPVGSAIYDANATDQDAGVHGDLRYAIVDGNPGDAVFIIDPVSGVVSVGSLLDYDTAPQSYALSINVMDNSGSVPALIDVMTLTVTLLDVNDNVPIFTQNTYAVTIDENMAVNTTVIAVVANDIDSGVNGNIGYSIESGDGGTHFTIDAGVRQISTSPVADIDYELQPNYVLVVKATDEGTPVKSSFCIVKITVTDLNDNDPVFNPFDFKTSLDENMATGTNVTPVYATDADSGANALLTFSIVGSTDPNGHFLITKLEDDTAQISTTSPLDREIYET